VLRYARSMHTRCPHCQAPVAAGAAFCPACGSALAGGGGATQAESPSLFELPVSRRARQARVAIVLALDAVLAGTGVAMIASYLDARAEAARALPVAVARPETPKSEGPKREANVEVAPPRVVRPSEPTPTPPARADGPKPAPNPPGKPPVATPPPKQQPPPKRPPEGPNAPPAAAADAAVAATPPAPADAAPSAPTGEPEQSLANGVQRTVEGHMGQVRRCWENVAKSSAESNLPEGVIEIQFAVLASGNPSSVQVVQNQTGSPALADCVVALVNSWDFPKHDGDPVVFVWPFFFKASK
jgi:outer membrane biosynthesis protein TonB